MCFELFLVCPQGVNIELGSCFTVRKEKQQQTTEGGINNSYQHRQVLVRGDIHNKQHQQAIKTAKTIDADVNKCVI